MRPIAALVVLAALFSADVAAAAGASAVHHRSPARHTAARLHKASQTTHRRARQHPTRTATLTAANPPAEIRRAADTDAEASDRSGWFKSEKDREAGWGIHRGGSQTVVGLYQRPPQPDIPGPQTYHSPEGRGAAGLSLSFKLGR